MPAPRPQLRTRVLAIDIVENDGGESSVLPAAGAVLGIQFRGGVHAGDTPLTTAGVTGIQSTLRRYVYAPRTGTVLVRFTPQGTACLGVPASELTGQSVGLEQLLARGRVAELAEKIASAATNAARVAMVEELLLSLPGAEDPLVAHAVARLESSSDDASVARLAKEVGLSERQLERRFLARVGVGPQRFASLRRLERAVALARSGTSLSEVAYAAGYADQSHFNREFRRYAQGAPSKQLPLLR